MIVKGLKHINFGCDHFFLIFLPIKVLTANGATEGGQGKKRDHRRKL